MEIWKDAVDYEQYFKVSNKGSIFSKRTNKLLKLCLHKNGYYVFSTRLEGRKSKAICLKVHRLVAKTFLDNPERYPIVNHKDGVKTNNTVENLEWCSSKQNVNHAIKAGLTNINHLKKFSEESIKLTPDQINYLKNKYIPFDKNFGQRALARKFSVNKSTIRKYFLWEANQSKSSIDWLSSITSKREEKNQYLISCSGDHTSKLLPR